MSVQVVIVAGDAYARGRAAGARLAPKIERSLAFYRGLHGHSPSELAALVAPYREAAERSLPELVSWLEGLAAGARVPFAEVLAVNAFEELEPQLSPATVGTARCTTVVARGHGRTLLGHNEQWFAGDAENVAVVVELPDDGVPIVSPTIATCLPAVGLNGHGWAQGIDSLSADDDRSGVPRVLVSRHALDARGREDAIRRAGIEGRAGGYAHVLAGPGGETVTIETTATELVVVEESAHTNHYLSPGLAGRSSSDSRSRHARATELMTDEPVTPEDVMALLADHAGGHESICRHDDPDASVLFSMVCDVEARRLWVAPGPPCTTPYEEIDLADVV